VTYVAQWSAIPYTITYDPNGGSGAPIDPNTYIINSSVTVLPGIPTRPGYTFTGWLYQPNTSTNIFYYGGNTFPMPVNGLTLLAQWEAIPAPPPPPPPPPAPLAVLPDEEVPLAGRGLGISTTVGYSLD